MCNVDRSVRRMSVDLDEDDGTRDDEFAVNAMNSDRTLASLVLQFFLVV